MEPIHLTVLNAVFEHMVHRVRYTFGAKPPSLDCDSHMIDALDCSGFTRYIIARASEGQILLPDGSVEQHRWCQEQGLHQLSRYDDVHYAIEDAARLFIAFIEPDGKRPGHVWLVTAGKTLECHGHAGVDNRPWNTEVLRVNACACYELPTAE